MVKIKNMDNQDTFIHLYSLYAAITIVIIIGYFLSYIPNELDKEFILNNYNVDLKYFVAENSEKAQYVFCTALFPVIYLFLSMLIQRLITIHNSNIDLNRINDKLDLMGFLLIYLLLIFTNCFDNFYLYCCFC